MKKLLLSLPVVLIILCISNPSYAYIMQKMGYKDFFERANTVVIATPIESVVSTRQLTVSQPDEVQELIETIDTVFEVAQVLKGDLKSGTFHFLHLNRKNRDMGVFRFGAVGTFFIDFNDEKNKEKSYILFMDKLEDGSFRPAWNPRKDQGQLSLYYQRMGIYNKSNNSLSQLLAAIEKDGGLE